jgi:hypothetical protein
MSVVDSSRLWVALHDAVSLAREMDGAPLAEKLARFDLDQADLAEVLRERWETYRATLPEDIDPALLAHVQMMFVRAMTEGVLTGIHLKEDEA